MLGKKIAISVALVAVLTGFGASQAGAYVYWTDYAGDSIGRAGLDGLSPSNSFLSGAADGPVRPAVDGAYIYWASEEGTEDKIGRAALDGSQLNGSFITTAPGVSGVAVDGSHIYWTNYETDTIGRANLDGNPASVENTFIVTETAGPSGLAVDASHIYWASGLSTVGRADINGAPASVEPAFIGGQSDPVGVAIDASHIYWGNYAGDTIGRANLNGSGAATNITSGFIMGADGPGDVAVDGSHIYWANENGAGAIGRAGLGGEPASVNQSFITFPAMRYPTGVAVDALSLPPASTPNPPAKTPPSNAFTIEPRISCAGVCHVISVKVTFDSAGSVIAEDAIAGEPANRTAIFSKKRQPYVKKTTKGVPAPGTMTIKLKLTATAQKVEKKNGKVKVKVRFTFTPSGGPPKSQVRSFTAKPKKKGG